MKATDYFEKYSPLMQDATNEEQSDVILSTWEEFGKKRIRVAN